MAAGVVGFIAATTVQLATALAGRVPSLPLALLILAGALALLYFWRSKLNLAAAILLSGIAGYFAMA